MTVRERVLASRLVQKIENNADYAKQIGLSFVISASSEQASGSETITTKSKGESDMMGTTLHSIDRVKERCNLKSQHSAEKNICRALQRGKRADDYASWERSYLSNEGYNNCVAVAYNGFCYIVNENNICVTVHSLPHWFGKKKHFDGKEKIRNYKKYCKDNYIYEMEYVGA